jgi:hypothetical protein
LTRNIQKNTDEATAQYVEFYAEIDAWLGFAGGGELPASAIISARIDPNRQIRFLRGASRQWRRNYRVSIAQVMICSPVEEFDLSELQGLCSQASTVLEHLHGDAYVGLDDEEDDDLLQQPSPIDKIRLALVTVTYYRDNEGNVHEVETPSN